MNRKNSSKVVSAFSPHQSPSQCPTMDRICSSGKPVSLPALGLSKLSPNKILSKLAVKVQGRVPGDSVSLMLLLGWKVFTLFNLAKFRYITSDPVKGTF